MTQYPCGWVHGGINRYDWGLRQCTDSIVGGTLSHPDQREALRKPGITHLSHVLPEEYCKGESFWQEGPQDRRMYYGVVRARGRLHLREQGTSSLPATAYLGAEKDAARWRLRPDGGWRRQKGKPMPAAGAGNRNGSENGSWTKRAEGVLRRLAKRPRCKLSVRGEASPHSACSIRRYLPLCSGKQKHF